MQTRSHPSARLANRVFNFSPGPAALPDEVMVQAQQELLNWRGTGTSVMEMSHRNPLFIQLAEETVTNLATLINLPESHTILYTHGGARTQFAMVPLNLGDGYSHAHYANTGVWSELAISEAKKYLTIETITSTTTNDDDQTVLQHQLPEYPNASYVHYTPNETVNGLLMPQPNTTLPLVADATSTLLALNMNIAAHDVIYASAQKNLGIAGVTFIIIKKSVLQHYQPMAITPDMLRYQNHFNKDSMFNTPSTFSLYMSGLMFKWQLSQGGIAALAANNLQRSQAVYQLIDRFDCYENNIADELRSPINITFKLRNEQKTAEFLAFAEQYQLIALKGHRAVGGIRASLYNGVPNAAVERLLDCMTDYATQYA